MLKEMVEQVRALLTAQVAFAPGEWVVVAVSGGVDSMVLLDLMDRLRASLEIQLCVAHLDHQLRPTSAEDSRFVAEAARQRGLPCRVGCRDVGQYARQRRLSLEAAARQLRYQFLEEVAAAIGAQKIALGHHADDQAETVLLRLLRGSGATGLGGMEIVREGRYLRPLLGFERAELEAYARCAGIDFRQDATNRDLRFARNWVRHELMPLLRRFNPRIVRVLNRTAQVLREEDRLLAGLSRQALPEVAYAESKILCSRRKRILDVPRLFAYPVAMQRRILRAVLQDLSEREGPSDFVHLEKVLALLRQSESGVRVIAAGLGAQRAGRLLILGPVVPLPLEIEVNIPGEIPVPECGAVLRAEVLPAAAFAELRPGLGGLRAAFDAERLGTRLQLRRWRPGDRFQPLGMEGRKKVSDFLVDEKWPRLLRDEALVLTRPADEDRREEIVWLVGMRLAHPYRVSADTRQLALLEVVLAEGSPSAKEG